MAVKIKLMRLGKIRAPYYRIVVADSRTKRDGRSIETIGKYHPTEEPSLIEVDSARVQYWLSVGAQPTEPVAAILRVTGDWQKFKGEPGAEGTLRTAAPRADRKAAFEAAAREGSGEPEGGAGATTPRARKAAASRPVEATPDSGEGTAAPGEAAPADPAATQAAAPETTAARTPAPDTAATDSPASEPAPAAPAGTAAPDAQDTPAESTGS